LVDRIKHSFPQAQRIMVDYASKDPLGMVTTYFNPIDFAFITPSNHLHVEKGYDRPNYMTEFQTSIKNELEKLGKKTK
jgi:hypothetical protein